MNAQTLTSKFEPNNFSGSNYVEKKDTKMPFLMRFLEEDRIYSLSQGSTTACSYSTGQGPNEISEMTPDD
jgi:hypothetical protein